MESTFHQNLSVNTFETEYISFPSELYMEGIIIQNSKLIAFDVNDAPEILCSQLSFNEKEKNSKRIDLVIKNDDKIGIVELKKGNIDLSALSQISNYLSHSQTINKKLIDKEIIDKNSIKPENYFGLIVGTGIDEETLKSILNRAGELPKIYVIIIQRHKIENAQLFLTSNILIKPKSNTQNNVKLDFTKYSFMGKNYGKGRLVLAVMEDFIAKDNNKTTIKQLNNSFPKDIQGSYQMVIDSEDVENSDKLKKRYFASNPIRLPDNTEVLITNQWGIGNIDAFIKEARKLKYDITTISTT